MAIRVKDVAEIIPHLSVKNPHKNLILVLDEQPYNFVQFKKMVEEQNDKFWRLRNDNNPKADEFAWTEQIVMLDFVNSPDKLEILTALTDFLNNRIMPRVLVIPSNEAYIEAERWVKFLNNDDTPLIAYATHIVVEDSLPNMIETYRKSDPTKNIKVLERIVSHLDQLIGATNGVDPIWVTMPNATLIHIINHAYLMGQQSKEQSHG